MSTIAAANISNLAGSAATSVDTVVNGSAKAWVNFNGTGTVSIRASFNVASITDLGVGSYWVNYTNAISLGAAAVVSQDTFNISGGAVTNPSETTRCYVSTVSNGANTDMSTISVAVFR